MTSQASGTDGSTEAGNVWYGDGTNIATGFHIQITGNMGKAFSSQGTVTINSTSYASFKNSKGAQNTITVPTGYVATSVSFYVTANADADATLSEFNGESCSDAVTSHKDGANPTVITKSLSSVSSFTFTFSTNQVLFAAVVTYASTDTRDPLTLSFTPDGRNVVVGDKLATSLSWTEDTSGESAKYTTTYESSDEDVVTVDEEGVVTAVANGTATITATVTAAADATYRTSTASIQVNVVPTLSLNASVALPATTLDLSDADAASTMLVNGSWINDRPVFGNDGDNNHVNISVFGGYQSRATQTWSTVSTDGANYGASTGASWDATGVFAGSSAYPAAKCATSRVGDRPYTYYSYRVKGVSKVQALGKSNSTSVDIILAAFEMTGDTPASTTLLYAKDRTKSDATLTVELDEDKTYLVVLYGEGSSNNQLYEVAFFYDSSVDLYASITPAYAWSTYVAPAKLDFSGIAGLKAYVATNAAAGKVTLEPVGAVPAGTPLMLVGTAGTEYTVPVAAEASALGTNMFEAGDGTTVFDDESTTSYDYILFTDGKFYRIKTGTTVPVGKAYLHCDSNPTTPLARELRISFGDNITGIDQIDNGQLTIDNSQDGKFIENGKLVIVKKGVKYNAAGAQVK